MRKGGLFYSKTVRNYLNSLGIKSYSLRKKEVIGFKNRRNLFFDLLKDVRIESYPVIVCFHFVRNSRRSFDFNNATHIILDLLVAHKIIEDDSMDYVIPQCYWKDSKHYTYDKNNPGVYIKFIDGSRN